MGAGGAPSLPAANSSVTTREHTRVVRVRCLFPLRWPCWTAWWLHAAFNSRRTDSQPSNGAEGLPRVPALAVPLLTTAGVRQPAERPAAEDRREETRSSCALKREPPTCDSTDRPRARGAECDKSDRERRASASFHQNRGPDLRLCTQSGAEAPSDASPLSCVLASAWPHPDAQPEIVQAFPVDNAGPGTADRRVPARLPRPRGQTPAWPRGLPTLLSPRPLPPDSPPRGLVSQNTATNIPGRPLQIAVTAWRSRTPIMKTYTPLGMQGTLLKGS